jgi:SAM-dependent methyltransferase
LLDLIANLAPDSRVLDLGAARGSFSTSRNDLIIVRVDASIAPNRGAGNYVAADAARLPFPDDSFDLIVSNHSLEHFLGLEDAVREIGRVIRPSGSLYVAVPDAGTLTDHIYRWLGRGGGHVNAFRSVAQVAGIIERGTSLHHRSTRALYSSLSFLNRHNFSSRPPRKIALFAFGDERFIAVFIWILRLLDRAFGSRLSQYGWAFYFTGSPPDARPEELEVWANACVRCGSGHSDAFLEQTTGVRKSGFWLPYRCPQCGGWNLFTRSPG